jgi:DNA-binding NtrC family response regulator
MARPTILAVDDEDLIRWSLKQRLEENGYTVVEAENGRQALERCSDGIDLVLLDYRLPDTDGLGLLKQVKAQSPETPVIMMTAYSTIESAVESIKQGAYHYVNKPFEMDEMLHLVEKALETSRLRLEVRELRARESEPFGFDRILGESPVMAEVRQLLRKVAVSPASTVLLTGESGTGKDLAARAIHYNGERSARPFMHITCSAVPESLLESELFGHERGAFTDARARKKGLFELADGGTVYLDEISEMTPALQAKLLRVLEEKAFKRVGGAQDVRVDVRVIAATNREIEQAVSQGQFRADLFFRLNVLTVRLPPLRDRRGDVPLLVEHFIRTFSQEFRKPFSEAAPAVLQALQAHHWPGNVRELRNVIERAVLLTDHEVLQVEDLGGLAPRDPSSSPFRLPPEGVRFESLEQDLVRQALERAGGNQTRAAALLGMNRDQIRYRIEKFGLSRPESARSGAEPSSE